MIKVVGINNKNVQFNITYIEQVKTYNITTEFMSNECTNYRVEQSNMIWLNHEGAISEIESIYPKTVQKECCYFAKQIKYLSGFPRLHIIATSDDFCIQHAQNKFIMWFAKEKIIDVHLQSENIDFYIGKDELLGIHCRKIKTII